MHNTQLKKVTRFSQSALKVSPKKELRLCLTKEKYPITRKHNQNLARTATKKNSQIACREGR